jgi:hypothetical protein
VDASPELVKKITEAVLAALAGRADSGAAPTTVHAPMGICTGDYSKFPELAGKQAGAAPPAAENSAAPTGPVFSGVVTASKLQGLERIIYLAPGARLSPLAMDVAKQRGLKVQTVADAVAAPHKPASGAGGIWLWWMQGHCPSAARVIEQLSGKAVEAVTGSTGQDLPAAIRGIAGALGSSKAKLAVLFVPAAARAVCLANRCPGLRAVVGTCRQAVQEGIELLGVNVLVLEYPHHAFKSMAELTGLFLTSSGYPPKEVQQQLADLAACK